MSILHPANEPPSAPAHDAHNVGHVVPLKLLVAVFSALTVLTVVTVAASNFDFGEYNLIVAMAIAVVKASLVVLFFMHLFWDKPFNAIVFVGCLIFVGLFISLALLDTTQYHKSVWNQQSEGMKTRVLMPAPTEKPADKATDKPAEKSPG